MPLNQEVQKWEIDLAGCRPLGDHVLLQRIEHPETGLIVAPEIAKTRSHSGLVIAVGPGRDMGDWTRPCAVEPGQVVRYMSCDMDDGEHVLIAEGDILFIESNA